MEEARPDQPAEAGAMALTPEQKQSLWGDEGPYSQVQVIREVRILHEGLGRTFFYVKANVNPTTYHTLKAMEAQIEDQEVLDFLKDAAFVSDDEGYEWHVYGQEAMTPRGANRMADQVTDVVLRMHRLVMDRLELRPPRDQKAPAPEMPPAHAAPDAEPPKA
jgi:hypothetical protein